MRKTVVCALWLIVIGWMVLIFVMSSQSSEVSQKTSGDALEKIYDLSHSGSGSGNRENSEKFVKDNQERIRSSAHFLTFSVLGVCTASACLYSFSGIVKKYVLAPVITVAYAFSDELHQNIVPGRGFQWEDVGLDIAGAVCGVLIVYLMYCLFKRRINSSDFSNKKKVEE